MKRETAKNKDYRRSKKKEKLEDKKKNIYLSSNHKLYYYKFSK